MRFPQRQRWYLIRGWGKFWSNGISESFRYDQLLDYLKNIHIMWGRFFSCCFPVFLFSLFSFFWMTKLCVRTGSIHFFCFFLLLSFLPVFLCFFSGWPSCMWGRLFTCCFSVFLFSLVAKLIRKCGPGEVDIGLPGSPLFFQRYFSNFHCFFNDTFPILFNVFIETFFQIYCGFFRNSSNKGSGGYTSRNCCLRRLLHKTFVK